MMTPRQGGSKEEICLAAMEQSGPGPKFLSFFLLSFLFLLFFFFCSLRDTTRGGGDGGGWWWVQGTKLS